MVYSLNHEFGTVKKEFEIDHKLPTCAIKGMVFDNSYIMSAVNGVGVFKWLLIYDPKSSKQSMNPENATKKVSISSDFFATLVKIMPVTRGFSINSLIMM